MVKSDSVTSGVPSMAHALDHGGTIRKKCLSYDLQIALYNVNKVGHKIYLKSGQQLFGFDMGRNRAPKMIFALSYSVVMIGLVKR